MVYYCDSLLLCLVLILLFVWRKVTNTTENSECDIYAQLELKSTSSPPVVAYHPITGETIDSRCVLVSFDKRCKSGQVFGLSQPRGYLHGDVVDWWMGWWSILSHGSWEFKVCTALFSLIPRCTNMTPIMTHHFV